MSILPLTRAGVEGHDGDMTTDLLLRPASYDHLAGRPPSALRSRGPLCRGRIAAAEGDVREMLAVLTGALPITARGAAMASVLLSDGTGPLHNRRSPLDLGAEIRHATRQMDLFAGARTDGSDRDSTGWYR